MRTMFKVVITVILVFAIASGGLLAYTYHLLSNQDGEYNYHLEEGDSLATKDGTVSPGEGNKFVLVTFEVRNKTDHKLYVVDTMFRLKDSNGDIYKVSDRSGDYVSYVNMPDPLGKNARFCYNLVFVVPEGVALTDLAAVYASEGSMTYTEDLCLEKYFQLDGTIVTS